MKHVPGAAQSAAGPRLSLAVHWQLEALQLADNQKCVSTAAVQNVTL